MGLYHFANASIGQDIDFNNLDTSIKRHPAELRRLLRDAVLSALPEGAPVDYLSRQSTAAMEQQDQNNQHISWERIVDRGYNGLCLLGSQKPKPEDVPTLVRNLANIYSTIDERRNDRRMFPPTANDFRMATILVLPDHENGTKDEFYRGKVFYDFVIQPKPQFMVLGMASLYLDPATAAAVLHGSNRAVPAPAAVQLGTAWLAAALDAGVRVAVAEDHVAAAIKKVAAREFLPLNAPLVMVVLGREDADWPGVYPRIDDDKGVMQDLDMVLRDVLPVAPRTDAVLVTVLRDQGRLVEALRKLIDRTGAKGVFLGAMDMDRPFGGMARPNGGVALGKFINFCVREVVAREQLWTTSGGSRSAPGSHVIRTLVEFVLATVAEVLDVMSVVMIGDIASDTLLVYLRI
ncbi:hypothetical protein AMAG_03635 [Allomyces macrogynus ATCC 38327]|uniref:Uncharacterized protein n=1 Tax=Allomyces macrogynus (strain ATCC 38327) TaxID=578462 RepID=A0A0L0SA70_ALLM3|nr:hypothetical protein AMAG_03635 [Allomyces macrogynus ATCC 38327]|eukprot:KNE59337.1 hypothetical protein AMAG_03635 [Allomyces macrogynus ATCC 38327]